MTPVEKAAAITLAADNLERTFHSALHTLRELGAPGAEALRLHQSTFSAASAAADDVAEALRLADEPGPDGTTPAFDSPDFAPLS